MVNLGIRFKFFNQPTKVNCIYFYSFLEKLEIIHYKKQIYLKVNLYLNQFNSALVFFYLFNHQSSFKFKAADSHFILINFL